MSATEPTRLSAAMEDYLRVIFLLEEQGRRASTTAVAASLGVAAASASVMLKRLAASGLVDHAPYRGVVLTDMGRRCALELVRHHRLLEQYLAEALGVPLDEVHAEADRLEHVLSEELELRIAAALGHPTHDPHGHPIPDAALDVAATAGRPLAELQPGGRAIVRSVPDRDPDLLRYLGDVGLLPGLEVRVASVAPFGGPITLDAGSGEHAISRELADEITVV